MKNRGLLAAMVAAIGALSWAAWPQSVQAESFNYCSLRLMTYNIRSAINLGPAEQGLEKLAQVIEAAGKPDVLMLQEVMRFDPLVGNIDEFQWLKDRLGYPFGYFTSGQADPVAPGTAEWGNAIYLGPDTGSVIGTQKYRIGWNRSLCRVTVSVQGTTTHFFCTHTGSGAIAEQVQTITGIIDDFTALQQPVILGGDFNATWPSGEMALLRQYLEEVFVKLGLSVNSIDTFYVSPQVTAHSADVVHDETYASDHDPVRCVLSPWASVPGPTITQQPQTQDRCPGDTVVLSVAAGGNGTLSYQWQLDKPNQQRVNLVDAGRISGATSPTLTISDVAYSDVARYRCVVTDNDCSRASAEAVLTLTPTAIVTQPASLIVGEGGTARLSVVARGAGTLNYRWQKNQVDLSDDGRIAGSQSADLRIVGCVPDDQGNYRCVVSGYCGTQTSSAATLSVVQAPPVTFFENWESYAEGSNDPAYLARWLSIPGVNRFDVWVGAYDEFSPPNAAKVRVLLPMGISHPLAPELTAVVPGADQVRGTDAHPLELLVKLYLQYSYLDTSDVFAELSMGDVRAPSGNSTTVLPVLAFGLTAGTHGAARYPRFFDGKSWNHVTGVSTNGGHNDLKMTVRTGSVQLQGLRYAIGSATLTRLYTGGFDRLSLRTVNNTEKWRSISDVSLAGGAVKAPLSVNAGADKQLVAGRSTILDGTATGGTPPYSIAWSPAAGLNNPQLLQPTASPTVTTAYTLTVTDSTNDSRSDSVLVTVFSPEAPADFDLDGDVDQEDFGRFQTCFTGPTIAVTDPNCLAADFDGDNDVDQNDFVIFHGCMSGADVEADPLCAN